VVNDGLRQQVERLIATEMGPILAIDGGYVDLVNIDQLQIELEFRGSCGRCMTRHACAAELVIPALAAQLGHSALTVRVRNAPMARPLVNAVVPAK
jgi:Fe-S cluster biogenesis protein NfuA